MRLILALLAALMLASCAKVSQITCDLKTPVTVQESDVHPLLQAKKVEDFAGVQFHSHERQSLDRQYYTDLGARLFRADLVWDWVEPTPGVYDWTHIDYFANLAEETGSRGIITVNYANNNYPGYPFDNDESRDAMNAMLVEGAARYADKPIIWELWNEPMNDGFWYPDRGATPEEYFQWAKGAAEHLLMGNPNACIVGAASSGIELWWNTQVFELGYLEYVDAVTVHPYRTENPETVLDDIEDLRAAICANGGDDIPLIFGEWGYVKRYFDNPDLSAAYAVRMVLIAVKEGVGGQIWYDWRDDPGAQLFIDDDWNPTVVYEAYSEMLDELTGFELVEDRSQGETFVLVFENDAGERKLAHWASYSQRSFSYEGQEYTATYRPQYVSLP